MENRGKYWLIALLGILLIIVAGVASAGRNRVPDLTGGADTTEQQSGNLTTAAVGTESLGEAGSGDLENYLREQDTIMAKMMRDMEDIPKTGSADLDFLNGMIPHHQSAVEMAKSYLDNGGQDQRLTELAGEIIEVQKKEIDQMSAMITRLEAGGKKNEEKEEAYLKEYNQMFASHQMDHSGMTDQSGSAMQEHMTEDPHAMHNHAADSAVEDTDTLEDAGVDAAFAEGMMMHHQMAVDMAEAILNYSEDEEVQTLSHAIIEAQEKEIREMQEILTSLTNLSS